MAERIAISFRRDSPRAGKHRQQGQIDRHENRDCRIDGTRMKPVDSLLQPPLARRVGCGQYDEGEYRAATAVADRERRAEDEQDVGAVEGEPGERAR